MQFLVLTLFTTGAMLLDGFLVTLSSIRILSLHCFLDICLREIIVELAIITTMINVMVSQAYQNLKRIFSNEGGWLRLGELL
ncbi:MAG: hypothetical protein ABIF87_11075 [Pseudomonadota bacterium]